MRVLIVGAGIGGLTAAIALRRAGIEAVVLERAPELREVGAGISLWPNAIHAFRRLGVGESVEASGARVGDTDIRVWQRPAPAPVVLGPGPGAVRRPAGHDPSRRPPRDPARGAPSRRRTPRHHVRLDRAGRPRCPGRAGRRRLRDLRHRRSVPMACTPWSGQRPSATGRLATPAYAPGEPWSRSTRNSRSGSAWASTGVRARSSASRASATTASTGTRRPRRAEPTRS